MRQHELLYFIDALTCWLEQHPEAGHTAPTREELTTNYFKHHEKFAGDGSSMRNTLRQLRLKKAVKFRACSEGCHAAHIYLTSYGRALLERWNEEGCDSENSTEQSCVRLAQGFTAEAARFVS